MMAARLAGPREAVSRQDLTVPGGPAGAVVLRRLACRGWQLDRHVWCGGKPDVIWPLTPGHEGRGDGGSLGAGVSHGSVCDWGIAPLVLA